MNKIEINNQTKQNYYLFEGCRLTISPIVDWIKIILNTMNIDQQEISILLCDNKTIQQLNDKYRYKNQPTDVLSFLSDRASYLGDIAISLDKVVEQAAEYAVSFADELQRLLIHGILHLLGFDHERSAEDEKKMFSKEEALFQEVKKQTLC